MPSAHAIDRHSGRSALGDRKSNVERLEWVGSGSKASADEFPLSATTACWPVRPAKPTSLAHEPCWRLPRRLTSLCPTNPPICVLLAPASAATWSSSRPSSAGDSRESRQTSRSVSRSSRHDPAWPALYTSCPGTVAGSDNACTAHCRCHTTLPKRCALPPAE